MHPNQVKNLLSIGQAGVVRQRVSHLGLLCLIAALGCAPAYAGKKAASTAPGKANESCECVLPWREYTRQPTPEIKALFEAAANVDEAAFSRLIGSIPELSEYAVDGQPLLAVLLSPAKNLPVDHGKRQVWWEMSPEQAAAIRAAHAATLPAKQRMLALALQHGASVTDVTYQARRPPLHLATVFGSPEMVRLLLQHGAKVDAVDADSSQTAVEFALDHEFFVRMTSLPVLVDPVARTEMLMAMLAAGAGRPYTKVDKYLEKESGKPVERPAADYLLWPALATLTRGGEVMEAFARTGTSPAFDADTMRLSPLAYAARSGNLGGVRWLKARAPRVMGDGGKYGRDERQFDTWLLAASWALYPMRQHVEGRASVDEILGELIQPGMPWEQENDLADDERNPLLSNRNVATSRHGRTLLHHLVFTGNETWVRRVVGFGAPVDGDVKAGTSPLLLAVRVGNAGMVRLLLSLGADPLAAADRENSPLIEAIAPDRTYSDDREGEAEKSRLKEARRETLSAMLAVLSPQQKAALGQEEKSPLTAALSNYGPVDGSLVRTLLESGIPATNLDSTALARAMASDDRELVGLLLDHGLSLHEDAPAADGAPAQPSLVMAFTYGRTDLLPRLLQAGANPNLPTAQGYTAVAYAITSGDMAALDVLQAAGGRTDLAVSGSEKRSLLELAIFSDNEAMLSRLSPSGTVDLSDVCLRKGDVLRKVVLGSSDPRWASMLGQGLGRPAADASACAGLAPFVERLLSALLAEPDYISVGWLGQRLADRARDLAALTPLPAERGQELLKAAIEAGREDVADALTGLGVMATPPAKAAAEAVVVGKPSAADLAMQRKLVGHYYLENQREVGSEILLRANGQFEYALAYGAHDEAAVGQWRVKGKRVIFSTAPQADAPGWAPYQRMPAPEGAPVVGDAESVEVAVSYQGQAVSDVSVTVMGCAAPAMVLGATDATGGWRADISGPLCQIVLRHPSVNGGRNFVYQVPAKEHGSNERRFVFAAQPSLRDSATEFNVSMSVDKGVLVWQRSGRALRYIRH